MYNDIGIPQGSSLSFFLLNIYLTELDGFIERLKKKKKFNQNIDVSLRTIFYARFANDYFLGIVGPKLFTIEVTNQIKTFILRNLKFTIKNIQIIHRDEAGVKFLGFKLYLLKLKIFFKVKNSEIQSIKKNIAISKARLSAGLIRNSHAFYNGLRNDIIKYLDKTSSKANNSKLENLIENKFLLPSKYLKYTKKRRYEIANHFQELFQKNVSLAMNSFNQNFKPLLENKEFETTKTTIKVKTAVEDFLKTLENIKTKMEENLLNKRKKEFFSKNFNLVKANQKDFLKAPINKSVRYISIRFPTKDFYDKFKNLGFIHPTKNHSIGKATLIYLADYEIVIYFNYLIRKYLN